ncbi:F0F1 ATP synthase subunit alpha [Candidatus Berkelbacteria bacterium]|nr:F0F1 ATP synthase subunit alpha [Candidatus Berkelbacteria bacterium]
MSTSTIVELIEAQINTIHGKPIEREVGTIVELSDGIARITGLGNAKYAEMIALPHGLYGVALNLEEDSIGVIVLGDETKIQAGQQAHLTGKALQIPVGMPLIGRVVNPLGEPLDGKGKISTKDVNPIEKIAAGVIARAPVDTPLQTGIKAIDAMIPIGRGQRELIIGDRQTGKTALTIDTIINQARINNSLNNTRKLHSAKASRGKPVYCIYVAIGQKTSKIAKIVDRLGQEGAMAWTTVVVTSANDAAALQYLAPYAGAAIGEYFAEHGMDALVIYDDLSKHAWAYRQISLLLRRPPGREAYPGDVFYLHSRLLERAVKLSDQHGGGSLTALPVIETQAGDISAYIPTNVISITDGQIFLETDLFYAGVRPALNVGLSVSRVGGAAQIKAMKQIAGTLRLELAQYRELAAFAQFATDLDETTRKQIERGKRISELLKQPQYTPVPVAEQIVTLYAVTVGSFDTVTVEEITRANERLLAEMKKKHPKILDNIIATGELDEKYQKEIITIAQSVIK